MSLSIHLNTRLYWHMLYSLSLLCTFYPVMIRLQYTQAISKKVIHICQWHTNVFKFLTLYILQLYIIRHSAPYNECVFLAYEDQNLKSEIHM